MFRKLDDQVSVAGQITPDDVAEAARQGFAAIVNNRPDGEQPGQPDGEEIAAAAAAAGLAYHAIPVDHSGLREDQIEAMRAALTGAPGPLLAFCRSGTRSTYLWALARSRMGDTAETILSRAGSAGYDLAPLRGAL